MSCPSDKCCHRSRLKARFERRKIERKHGTVGLCEYKCRLCGYWHVGRSHRRAIERLEKVLAVMAPSPAEQPAKQG